MTDMSTTSLLERAIYTYADVDRLNSLTPGTGRRWLEGFERGGVFHDPVLRDEPTGADLVSWGEMVEARLLAQFRGRRVSLQRLRPAVVRLRVEFGRYPLMRMRPFLEVDGRELVLRVQAEIGLEPALQFVVVRNGRMILRTETQRFAESVDYADGVASAIRPLPSSEAVRLDPACNFGQPSIRGIRTAVLAEDYRAGESMVSLAKMHDLEPSQVEDALGFEPTAIAVAG